MHADRNLLFGILALQMDFITRDQLIAGMNAWVLDKTKPLGQVLIEQDALATEDQALLDTVVERHLAKHGQDVQRSLAALSSLGSARRDLEQIQDADIAASLAGVSANRRQLDPDATRQPPTTAYEGEGSRYRILRPHARGGLGEVYVAHDAELHREVALKEIQDRHAANDQSRARFLLEAEITGGLEHPGIVPVYSLGHYADGRPFYAMRFIRGDNLEEAIRRFHNVSEPRTSVSGTDAQPLTGVRGSDKYSSLAFRQLLRRFVDVCNAVAYAHARGVLHRDLKPGNVMLGKYGETLVVDWGLAKATGTSRDRQGADSTNELPLRPASGSGSTPTQMGSAIGTPAYMSPEQAAGRLDELGPASDVYSLGATLFCVLTGNPPFGGTDVGEVLRRVQRGEGGFHQPAAAAGVPAPLKAICSKAMALKPADRYRDSLGLAQDVEHWLADEPVSCHSEPWSVRSGRWARKHRSLVGTAAAALVTATLGLAIGLYFVNAEKNRAELARQGEESQRIAAEKSSKEARERVAETTAVLDFVENRIFAAARPKDHDGGLGYDVKLADAVKAALPFIETNFKDQPLTEARIRTTMGASFYFLGDARTAAEQYETADRLLRHHHSPDHPDVLSTRHQLAATYIALGRSAEALPIYEETISKMTATFGADHPNVLKSRNNLAACLTDLGRSAEALGLYEGTLRVMREKLGNNHRDTLSCAINLAACHHHLGRTTDALKLYEELVPVMKATLGPGHADTLRSEENLATIYAFVNRPGDALRVREGSLPGMKALLGAGHPDVLMAQSNLASSFTAHGRHADALRLNEETLALRKTNLPPNHPDTLSSMYNLAGSLAALGRHEDAAALYQEALPLMKDNLGRDHSNTLWCMGNLALSLKRLKNHQAAMKLYEELVDIQKSKLGIDHPDTLQSTTGLLECLGMLGRHEEVCGIASTVLASMKVRFGPDHERTLWLMDALTVSQGRTGRHTSAIKLGEELVSILKAKWGPAHRNTLRNIELLALNHAALGQNAKALQLRQECLAERKAHFGADHPDTLICMAGVAASLYYLDRCEEALQITDECLQLAAGKAVNPQLVPGALHLRLRCFAKANDQAGCRSTAEKWEQQNLKDVAGLYGAACMRAVTAAVILADAKSRGVDATALAREEADKAMAWLQKTIAAGYQDHVHFRQNKDLDALRDRDDFKKLLAELEGKEK